MVEELLCIGSTALLAVVAVGLGWISYKLQRRHR